MASKWLSSPVAKDYQVSVEMPSLPPSFKRQQLLLEYAAIKNKCPEGIYLAPENANPATWSGVYFVRNGPYASAVLRFELLFPASYPEAGPAITFSTEIFHPLLVPLTTYTFASGALDPNSTISSSEAERLPPGSFNLRYGLPSWYPRPIRSDGRSGRSSSVDSGPSSNVQDSKEAELEGQPSLEKVLQYLKRAFEDADFLDTLPPRAAVNSNAWHAWRAHRGLPKLGSRSISPASTDSSRTPLSPGRAPGDWNWDGVWESRVRNGIDESMSDAMLYSSKNVRPVQQSQGPIRFVKNDDERTQEVQDIMFHSMGISSA